jgi:hypothetical protein
VVEVDLWKQRREVVAELRVQLGICLWAQVLGSGIEAPIEQRCVIVGRQVTGRR